MVVEHEPRDRARVRSRASRWAPAPGPHGGRILFDGTPAELAKRTDLPTGRAWAAPHERAPRRDARRARGSRSAARARTTFGASTSRSRSASSAPSPGRAARASRRSRTTSSIARRRARLGDTVGRQARARTTRSRASGRSARAVLVDQSPLGRTARGNPATYVKAWDRIRARFAAEPEAVRRGLTAGALLVQRPRRALRGVRRRGLRDGRDAVPRRRAAPLPGVPGQALQARGARGQAPRQESIADVLAMSVDEALAAFDPPDAARLRPPPRARSHRARGARVPAARAAALDALRRRGAAAQARARALARTRRARSSSSTSRARGCTRRTRRTW